MKKARWLLILLLATLLDLSGLTPAGWGQEAPKPPPAPEVLPPSVASPTQMEHAFPELQYPAVFDQVLSVLQDKGLYDHPHGKAAVDKEKGKITTPTYRYFRIVSARFPPKESDYRDTYDIGVSQAPVKVVIHRKFEIYDPEKKTWVEGDPSKEGVGISPEELMKALEAKLSAPAAAPAPAGADAKKEEKPAEKTP